MAKAEQAICAAAATLAASLCARFESTDKLADADRDRVLEQARLALTDFGGVADAAPAPALLTPAHSA